MDDVFKSLQKEGNNCAENLMKWMKDSGLIEDTEECQRNARVLFDNFADNSKVEFEKFKEIVQKIAKENNKTFEEAANRLAAEGPKIKAEFDEKVKPRIAEEAAAYEENLRTLLESIRSNNKEELDKVQEIFQKVAGESKKYLDQVATKVAAEGPRFMTAFEAGVKAFAESLEKSKKAKLVEATKDGEEKVRGLFSGVNPKNIELGKFKEVVERLAAEQNKTFDEIAKQLAAEGPKLLQTAMAGVAALKEKFSMK